MSISGFTEYGRNAIFDVYCRDGAGNRFIIEIQQTRQAYFKARSLFYSIFPISGQGKKGNWNFDLKKTYTICLMDFEFDDTHPDQILHKVRLIDSETNVVFNDLLMFLYIELPKFKKKENELITRLDQ